MAKRTDTKDNVNFRTVDALMAFVYQEAVNDLIEMGYTQADAERMAVEQSDGRDLVIQNRDGTFRLFQPRAGEDELTTTPEALEISRAANA